MGLFDLTDLAVQRGLEGAALEQEVLSNNLANANTAGFKRADVDFQSALATALDSPDPEAALRRIEFSPRADTATAMQADGNNVDLERELSALTRNAVQYETLSAIEKTRLGMLESAMGAS
ncbi:MAG TPA: flagellar basal body rod protein FlgB [Gaiellaceae bacterium]|nr:flagellar basal body rod protein FlgB [Gaiellaceae bacterium]